MKHITSIVCILMISIFGNAQSNKKYDIDFTKFNFNIASAQIFDMMVDADNYLGKTVRIKGKFYTADTEFGQLYSVLYYDATACCQTGLSFIPSSKTKLPGLLEDIEVCGIYKIKKLNGHDYHYIEQFN